MPFELNADHPGKIGLVNDIQHPVKIGMGLIPLLVELQCLAATAGACGRVFRTAS